MVIRRRLHTTYPWASLSDFLPLRNFIGVNAAEYQNRKYGDDRRLIYVGGRAR